MYVHPKLKLNKLRQVKCVTKKELFCRVGNVSQNVNAFTGDVLSELGKTKTEELADTSHMIMHTRAAKAQEVPTEGGTS